MKKTLTILLLTLAVMTAGFADVVRLAPDFSWPGIGNKRASLQRPAKGSRLC